ncbi:integral membrane sensor hybrid histidine kinase [Sulfuricurvum kujiense DSM 16994]|uniref:histidine kinase n=1 Tax=Sulfuricurvum kujiense (strain ATCC BAA-921 / DSM 16994 / JCM 11577 / YK-1) TaxID=709032 RepID=E4U1A7_SULKY|nr:ATP-binding protein [Sulfuricurvum kujiense]ADR34444.1 integral membrane sensor hybrid histidine kinase [Sulfuricurvum kujiense DSM 16994]
MIPFTVLGTKERLLLQSHYYEADKLMMWILLIHAFVAIFVTANYYNTYWLGIVGSAVILTLCSAAFILLRGTLWFRLIAAVAIMLFSAIYIQQHLGRIEMHFHVFIGLAILTIYKDVVPMFIATAAILIHHLLFNWMQSLHVILGNEPVMIFSYGCGTEYVILHGVMVIAETVLLTYIIKNSAQQFIEVIRAQEALDISNQQLSRFNITLEEQVRLRTQELESALQKHIGMAEDLKMAKEEAVSANQLKSEFLANMSHEIRTPLNSVIGFSDLLEQEVKEPKQVQYLHAIKNGGKALLSLINNILDLSKIESGHMKVELHPLHFKPFLREIMNMFIEPGKKKGLEVTYEIEKNLPEWIIADEIRIRQILFNLISNAIKFTEKGSVRLSVLSTPSKNEGFVDLIFSIKDTGIGISPKNQIKIFDAFIQNDGQDSRQFGGTGLGLAICRKLAQLMKGDITIESQLGQGSEFTFTIANIEISEALFAEAEEAPTKNTITFSSSKILIVDDIEENRILLHEFLNEFGFEIEEAVDGLEATELIREHAYDLVLTDIRMPRMDGWEAIRFIRDELSNHTLPVVAVTASVMKEDYEHLMKVFDGIIEKPVNKSLLISTLQRFLPYTQNIPLPEEESSFAISGLTPDEQERLKNSLSDCAKEVDAILESGDIELAEGFADKLFNIGNEFETKAIIKYASLLKENCESFNIESVESLLKEYQKNQKLWSIS